MTFVCTIGALNAAFLAPATSQTTCIVPVSYDDADGRLYRLFVTFGMAPGGIVDYSFCIVCDHKDGTSYDYWDSQVIASFIPRQARLLILDLLLYITDSIVTSAAFPEVAMHTFLPYLPPQALVKYQRITQIFTNAGYTVATSVHNGYISWRFLRATVTP